MSEVPLLQSCLCKLGGFPLEFAAWIRVELSEDKELRVLRTDSLIREERNEEQIIIQGKIKKVIVAKSRIERGLHRCDVTIQFEDNEKNIKLWLPRRSALKAWWFRQLGAAQSEITESFTDDDDDDETTQNQVDEAFFDIQENKIKALAYKLDTEESQLPHGWRQLFDKATGNAYYFNENSGRTTWIRPRGSEHKKIPDNIANEEALGKRLAVAWLLQRSIREEVACVITSPNSTDSPILFSLLNKIKQCPLFANNKDWLQTVDDFVQKMPELMRRAEAVSGIALNTALDRDGTFHLTQAVAQPLFILGLSSWQHHTEKSKEDEYSHVANAARKCASVSSDVLAEAIASSSKLSELPEPFRTFCFAILSLAALRLCRATRPHSERKQRLESMLETLPYSTIATAIRVGAFPTSPTLNKGLVDLFVKRQLSSNFTETIAQQVVRASLGLNDDEFKNMYNAIPPNLRRKIQKAPDISALERLPSELSEIAGVKIATDLRLKIDNAAALEIYKRRSEELVAAYGEPEYINIVSRLYPALLEPITRLLNDAKAQASDCILRAFKCVKRALLAADDCSKGKLSTADRALLAYTDLAGLTDNIILFLHFVSKRHTATDSSLWYDALHWLQRLLLNFSLSLDLPAHDEAGSSSRSLSMDISALLEKWQGNDTEDLAALATLADSDLPYLASLVPAFTADLRRQWFEKQEHISKQEEIHNATLLF